MNDEWRKKSVKIFALLLVITTLLFVFSCVSATELSIDEVLKTNNVTIGETVMEGESIEHSDIHARYPLISKPQYLIHEFTSLDVFGFVQSVSTGSVTFDYSSIAGEGISSEGISKAKGPGFVDVEKGKLVIHDCDYAVAGYLYQESYLVKNESGISIYVNGEYNNTIPTEQIRDQDWSGPNYNITTIIDWYNSVDNNYGSMFPLDMGVANFVDGRNNMSSQEIKEYFGEETYQYMLQYPSGDGVCVYIPEDYNISYGEEFVTTLGDHSEYGNGLRDFNANQFCRAWNNTILPPGASVCGKEYYYFDVAKDNESPGGAASHGVCPPARTLRACCLAEGFNLPVGMCGDENAVLYGYDPATGIFVTNNGDYPVKIIMWTEGSGVSMTIHCQFMRYLPPGYTFSNSSTSDY